MNIEATKLELMHLLLRTQKESILAKLKKVFEEEQTDWWDEMTEEEQQGVEEGLAQSKDGALIPDDEVKKLFDR